jgi:hypothetical protein
VALREALKVFWRNINDGPLIHDAISNKATLNQLPQPRRRNWIVFIVVCRHLNNQ